MEDPPGNLVKKLDHADVADGSGSRESAAGDARRRVPGARRSARDVSQAESSTCARSWRRPTAPGDQRRTQRKRSRADGRSNSAARCSKRSARNPRRSIRGMKVYLVGAGPGDPGLITLKGRQSAGARRLRALRLPGQRAPARLRSGSRRADLCRKEARQARMTQEEISALMVERARRGWTVVRLKGGDPFIFGAGRRGDRGSGRRRHSLRDRSGRHHASGPGRVHRRSADASRSFLGW